MSKVTSRLGRGLASLISTDPAIVPAGPSGLIADTLESAQNSTELPKRPGMGLQSISISLIRANPMQPRRTFDGQGIAALAESLRQRGALQPIVVRRIADGFELVAGERRLRAARAAGLAELPAIVRVVRDDELLELALIENIQRADLNPIERARGYQTLCTKYGLSHEEVAGRVGENRATVANYIRLLGLNPAIVELIEEGSLSTGHAKAILGLEDQSVQLHVANATVRGKWSVRQAEAAVAKAKGSASAKSAADVRPAAKDVEERLALAMGTRVKIVEGRKRHTGRIVIDYYNLDDFERITSRLGLPGESA